MSNYIILIISFINATIFFFSFLGKNKKTRIRTKFHILYLINSTSLLAYTLIKSIHLLNICLSIIVLITFQLSLLLLYEIIRIYLGIKERKLAKFLYFISAGLSFLVLTAYTTNLVNLKFALLLFEFFNFTILIYTFIITISTLLANPHYINSYSILCMIALLYSIILSPGIILTSYNSGLYLQPIILGSLLYILYL